MLSSSSKAAVRVVVRIRPDSSPHSTLNSVTANTVQFKTGEEYTFSSVLAAQSTQEETYDIVTRGLVNEALLGYNNTVLAYGQTSSGKTYTMMGGEDIETYGVIPRLAEELFVKLANVASENNQISIKVSFVEIYREKLRDLLNVIANPKTSPPPELKVREGDSKKVVVDGLSELFVHTKEELLAVMQRGNAARSIAATKMNEDSSRSHSVFTLKVVQQQGSGDLVIESKIQLVDLAGSEQVKRTGAHGDRLEEAKSINLSLSCLGNVVSALAEHSKFVPYRDSKLTRILQDSLGGTAKTCLICTISPNAANEAETLSTLRFGTRAQKVQNHIVKNIRRSEDELERLLAVAEEKIRQMELREASTAAVLPPISAEASTQDLFQRVEQLEHELSTVKAQHEHAQLELETLQKEKKQLEADLSQSTHKERTLQIDLKYCRDALEQQQQQPEQADWSMMTSPPEEDVSVLTEKCIKYQTLLNEAREEVEMLKKSKVDQVWMYLVETQDRLKQADQEKVFLTGELASMKSQMKHKQELMDEMRWEHAKAKNAMRDEVETCEGKIAQLREEFKRYRSAVEQAFKSGGAPPPAAIFIEEEDAAPTATTAVKRRVDEASFVSIDEE